MIVLFLLLVVVTSSQQGLLVSALAVPCVTAPTITNDGWRIALNIGREKDTGMSDSWAASGCRLPIVLRCDFVRNNNNNNNNNDDDGGNEEGSIVPKTNQVRFTGPDGEVVNPVESGTWKLSGGGRDLSFKLGFPDELVRRDVRLRGTVRCRGTIYDTTSIRALNDEYYAARGAKWDAGARVDDVARRRDAPKKWNFDTDQWEQRYAREGWLSQWRKRGELFVSERMERRQNNKRPQLRDLSSDCGPLYPGAQDDVYFVNKGGKIYLQQGWWGGEVVVGTWSAEPINDKPVSYY